MKKNVAIKGADIKKAAIKGSCAFIREAVLAVAGISLILPLLYMIFCSFKSSQDLALAPFKLTFDLAQIQANYKSVFTGLINTGRFEIQLFTPFFKILINQLIIVIAASVFMTVLATPIGYALGRRKFKGKKLVMLFVIFTQTVPLFGYLLSFYMLVDIMNLTNNLLAVGLIFSATSMPTSVIFMMGFFSSFPPEVEQAAEIDGAGELKRFLFIILPMAKGIIFSIVLIQFMGYWNEYALSNLLITDDIKRTISISIMITSSGGADYPEYIYPLLVLSVIPSLLFFSVFSKQITRGGVAMGSIKG